ncbi:hypothetical protein HDU76_010729, partial [Blyttiomyces sp. JEL0837]
ETNLKRRTAAGPLSDFRSLEAVSPLNLHIQCEKPNENLNAFKGRMSYTHPTTASQGPSTIPLSMSNLLLRGCVLRNTDFAYAVVVYTGANTKIIRNLKKVGLKSSRMEHRLNWLVCGVFVYNAILLFGSTALEYVHYKNVVDQENSKKAQGNLTTYSVEWYLPPTTDSLPTNFGNYFLSYFSLFTYVIPISLFVTIELVRLGQGRFMVWDKQMTLIRQPLPTQPNEKPQKLRMRANNTNLNEDLGAIEYIFSDKTGTLTQNEMRMAKWFSNGLILDEMEEPGVFGQKLRLFSRVLALCHNVIPTIDEASHMMIYESQSPDEAALLYGLAANDIKLAFRTKNEITITVFGETQKYELLNLIDFSSDRKRMSVIVRTREGKIHLYCKGADNIILGRLDKADQVYNSIEVVRKAEESLQHFSEFGLRTLMMGYRELTEEEYEKFKRDHDIAETSLNDRETKISEAAESVECKLKLVGCTAIEDRLQDEVPETIEYLLKAGIRLWLLTGDKQETAINIGMSSRLISSEMAVMILNKKTFNEVSDCLDRLMKEVEDRGDDGRENALVVTGEALALTLGSPIEPKLLSLGIACHSVICCRVTPLQKALVVKMVKKGLKVMTLAIGDGANDVSMIQAADVGVGIMGREGNQAVRSSDYAFGEFRFLRRLLCVHGRFSYLRLAGLIFYSFYKNLTAITVQWWFGFFNLWSGQIVYEELFFTAFNVIFTSVPPLFYALFEKDVVEDKIDEYAELYRQTRAGLYWNWTHIVTTLVSSVYHSLVIFFGVWYIEGDEAVDPSGRVSGYWVQCFLFGTPMLAVVLGKMSLMHRHWVWLTWLGILASMAMDFFVQLFVEYVYGGSEPGTFLIQHGMPVYWFTLILIPTICLLPDFALVCLKRSFFPSDPDIIMEENSLKSKSDMRNKRRQKRKTTAEDQVELQMTEIRADSI